MFQEGFVTMTKAILLAVALLATTFTGRAYAAGQQPVGLVYFTQWSALLDDAATAAVKQAATRVAGTNGVVTVTGYADTTGSHEANNLLSALRAQMVIDLMVADGVPANRLKRAARGATPDIGGTNESRRVLISVKSN
jgi:outer membrane protein OmpA-like peptidoglycan-associated protein